MSDTERLGYSRGVMEQLRASHEQLSPDELLDLVCHLTKTYVLDRTLPFALPHPEREQELRDDRPDAPLTRAEVATGATTGATKEAPETRFARLIENLKARTGLPQFDGFEVEGHRVVLIVDNQKITFGERVTVEFVPRQGNPIAPAPSATPPARRAPGAAEPRAERPQPGAPAPRPEPPSPAPTPPAKPSPDEGDDGYDPSVERFKRLDLD